MTASFLLSPAAELTDDEPTDDDAPCLWAWIAPDAKGGDSIIAGQVPGIGVVTLVTTSERHARSVLRDAAKHLARTGRDVELRRYDLAEIVERL